MYVSFCLATTRQSGASRLCAPCDRHPHFLSSHLCPPSVLPPAGWKSELLTFALSLSHFVHPEELKESLTERHRAYRTYTSRCLWVKDTPFSLGFSFMKKQIIFIRLARADGKLLSQAYRIADSEFSVIKLHYGPDLCCVSSPWLCTQAVGP